MESTPIWPWSSLYNGFLNFSFQASTSFEPQYLWSYQLEIPTFVSYLTVLFSIGVMQGPFHLSLYLLQMEADLLTVGKPWPHLSSSHCFASSHLCVFLDHCSYFGAVGEFFLKEVTLAVLIVRL